MNKLELKSSHEVVYTVDVADVDSIFHGKPIDPDILTVVMKDGKRLYCDEVCPIDSLQEKPVRNGLMSRKEDCLGCDRRRLEIVTIKNTEGKSVDIYMCRGLLDIPCPKGHGEFAR